MKPIISPVPKELLETELTDDKFVRPTNNISNRIYIISGNDSPSVMREIGRLRELTFRNAGGGSGNEIDVDEFDYGDHAYQQLIVWNPKEKEIVGGYRFIKCRHAAIDKDGKPILATSELFEFSDDFRNIYFDQSIELGRSFVHPSYQSSRTGRKGIFVMDNLWDGIGAVLINNPDIHYLFGKVTMYPHFHVFARDLIHLFINRYFADQANLIIPKFPVNYHNELSALEEVLHGKSYKDDYRLLSKAVRSLGENIPPLLNSYMNLSPSMKSFGTSINQHFGMVEETAILITLKDIYFDKIFRHVKDYKAPGR
ncbi:MAG: GNAT family N-acetyltransferase [Bacteroidia bacterium]|nr:GNAT family N-acetyltransferase [Bacteroidia bacterium]